MSPARLNRCISAAPVWLQPLLRQDPTQALRKGRGVVFHTTKALGACPPQIFLSGGEQRVFAPSGCCGGSATAIASSLPAGDLDLGTRAPDAGQGTSFNLSPSLGSRMCPELSPAFRAFSAKTLANSCRLGTQPDWGQRGRSYDCPLSESLLMDYCCPLWTRTEGERQL